MFGLEILDVVIGLMFVYLLLSLLATAINEYISAVMNLRGKELARGLGRLLDDFDENDALARAFNGVGPKLTAASASLTERFYNHRLIRPLATRRGGFFQPFNDEPRLPSYIPARTFAMALLDVLGVDQKDANIRTATDYARETAEKVAQRAEPVGLRRASSRGGWNRIGEFAYRYVLANTYRHRAQDSCSDSGRSPGCRLPAYDSSYPLFFSSRCQGLETRSVGAARENSADSVDSV